MSFTPEQKENFGRLVSQAASKLTQKALDSLPDGSGSLAERLAANYLPARGFKHVNKNIVADGNGQTYRVQLSLKQNKTLRLFPQPDGRPLNIVEIEKKHAGVKTTTAMLKRVLGENTVNKAMGWEPAKEIDKAVFQQLDEDASIAIANSATGNWFGYLEDLGFPVEKSKGNGSIVQFRIDGERFGLVKNSRHGKAPFALNLDTKSSPLSLVRLEMRAGRYLKWSDAIKNILGETAYNDALGFKDSRAPAPPPRPVYKPVEEDKPQPVNYRKLTSILERCQWGTYGRSLTEERKLTPEILADKRFAKSIAAFEFTLDDPPRTCSGTLFPMHFDGKVTSFERFYDKGRGPVADDPDFRKSQFKTGIKGFWRSQNSFPEKCSKIPVLLVAESPIDAMAHAQLFPDTYFAYIAACGNPQTKMIVEEFPRILNAFHERFGRYPHLVFGFDNDKQGVHYDKSFLDALPDSYRVLKGGESLAPGEAGLRIIKPPPAYKDWNDLVRGIKSPKLVAEIEVSRNQSDPNDDAEVSPGW